MDPHQYPLNEIIRLCLANGESAFWEELVNRLQPLFARIAFRLLGSGGPVQPQDIDDFVQSIFGKIGAHRGALLRKVPLETEQTAESYLKALAANAIRDLLRAEYAQRRDRSHTQALDDLIGEVHRTGQTSQAEQEILLTELDAALEATPKERTVFWLYYRGGLTAKEIASLPSIGLSPKGIESVVYRLTTALRETLSKSPASKTPTRLKGKTAPGAF